MVKELDIQRLFQSLQTDLNQLDEERKAARLSLFVINLLWLLLSLMFLVAAFWLTFWSKITLLFFVISFWVVPLYFLWRLRRKGIKEAFRKSFKEKLIDKIIKKVDPSFIYRPYRMTYRNENLLFLPVIRLFRKGYAKLFNVPLVNKAIKKVDPTFEYHPDNTHYPKERSEPIINHLKKTKLLPGFDECWVEDLIVGTVGKNKFEFSEITMRENEESGDYTLFQGILLVVYLSHSMPSPIFILPNTFERKLEKLFERMFPSTKRGDLVELEHKAFAILFRVYAAEPSFAKALLQESFLESLTAIHGKIAAINKLKDSIQLALVDNTITIAIRLKTNLFEPRLNRPVKDIAYIESNMNYLILFLNLIEDLDLNR